MILKTLTPEQTDTWISNLNKLSLLYARVDGHYYDTLAIRRQQFTDTIMVSKWKQFWYSVDSWYDVHHNWDGNFYVSGFFGFNKLKCIEKTPWSFMKLRDCLLDDWLGERDTVVERLTRTWTMYAEKPFQIDSTDLEMYYNVKQWHEELKSLAICNGVYDEAFNLDEDSV